MKRRLLDYLACRSCGRPFELRVEREEESEIVEGLARRFRRRHEFPHHAGYPAICSLGAFRGEARNGNGLWLRAEIEDWFATAGLIDVLIAQRTK